MQLLFHLYPFLIYFLGFLSFSSPFILILFLLLPFSFPLYRLHFSTFLLIFLFCFSPLISYRLFYFCLSFMDGSILHSEHQRINFFPHCKKVITLSTKSRSLSH